MKTLQEIKDDVTAVIVTLTTIQANIQALQDVPVTSPDVPEVPKITIPLNTPIELVV